MRVLAPIGHGGFVLILLFHMQAVSHFTSFTAGFILLPIVIGSIPGTLVAMLLVKKIGKWSVCLGGIIQATALVWVMITLEYTGTIPNGWGLLPSFALAGVGMMVLIMPQTSITLAEIPTTEVGAVSDTLMTSGQVGMMFGTVLPGTAYFGATGDSDQNVTAGLWAIVIAYIVSGLVAFTTPIRSSQEQPSPDPDEPS